MVNPDRDLWLWKSPSHWNLQSLTLWDPLLGPPKLGPHSSTASSSSGKMQRVTFQENPGIPRRTNGQSWETKGWENSSIKILGVPVFHWQKMLGVAHRKRVLDQTEDSEDYWTSSHVDENTTYWISSIKRLGDAWGNPKCHAVPSSFHRRAFERHVKMYRDAAWSWG